MIKQGDYQHFPESFRAVSEVAQAYFPNYGLTSSSVRRFRNELKRDGKLLALLEETGYKLENLHLSPRQIRIIYDRWGVPGRNSRFPRPDSEQQIY